MQYIITGALPLTREHDAGTLPHGVAGHLVADEEAQVVAQARHERGARRDAVGVERLLPRRRRLTLPGCRRCCLRRRDTVRICVWAAMSRWGCNTRCVQRTGGAVDGRWWPGADSTQNRQIWLTSSASRAERNRRARCWFIFARGATPAPLFEKRVQVLVSGAPHKTACQRVRLVLDSRQGLC